MTGLGVDPEDFHLWRTADFRGQVRSVLSHGVPGNSAWDRLFEWHDGHLFSDDDVVLLMGGWFTHSTTLAAGERARAPPWLRGEDLLDGLLVPSGEGGERSGLDDCMVGRGSRLCVALNPPLQTSEIGWDVVLGKELKRFQALTHASLSWHVMFLQFGLYVRHWSLDQQHSNNVTERYTFCQGLSQQKT